MFKFLKWFKAPKTPIEEPNASVEEILDYINYGKITVFYTRCFRTGFHENLLFRANAETDDWYVINLDSYGLNISKADDLKPYLEKNYFLFTTSSCPNPKNKIKFDRPGYHRLYAAEDVKHGISQLDREQEYYLKCNIGRIEDIHCRFNPSDKDLLQLKYKNNYYDLPLTALNLSFTYLNRNIFYTNCKNKVFDNTPAIISAKENIKITPDMENESGALKLIEASEVIVKEKYYHISVDITSMVKDLLDDMDNVKINFNYVIDSIKESLPEKIVPGKDAFLNPNAIKLIIPDKEHVYKTTTVTLSNISVNFENTKDPIYIKLSDLYSM